MDTTYGTLEHSADGRSRLRFTRSLPHPQEKVWRAITEPEHLSRWFPTTIEGERRAGATLTFSFPEGEAPPLEGELLVFEPPSVMEFRWGTDIVRIELQPTTDGTALTMLDVLHEHGKAARDGAGWHTCLNSLQAALGGGSNPREHMHAWKTANEYYVEAFGPEAATIGPPEGHS